MENKQYQKKSSNAVNIISFCFSILFFGLMCLIIVSNICRFYQSQKNRQVMNEWTLSGMPKTERSDDSSQVYPNPSVNTDKKKTILPAWGSSREQYRSPFPNIFEAAAEGTVDDVRFFVTHGVNVNVEIDGWTPLHHAVQYNSNADVLKYLIEQGANVNAKNNIGSTPLHEAACFNSNVEVLKHLVEKGANVNAKANEDMTPLHAAAGANPNVDILKYLIAQGANVSAKTNFGGTPLHVAAFGNSNVDVLKCLVEKGADVNAKAIRGMTALHAAAECNPNVDVLKYLIEKGANVNAKNDDGKTPLDHADTEEKKTILRNVVSTGNNSQIPSKSPNTSSSVNNTVVENKGVPLVEIAKINHDVVISISSFGELRKAVIDTANKMNPMIGVAVANYLGNDSPILPKGMATNGPIGLVANVNMNPNMPFKNVLAFMPVKDEYAFRMSVDQLIPEATVKMKGKNALLTLEPTTIIPADQVSLLGGLEKRYLLAVQISPTKFADLAKFDTTLNRAALEKRLKFLRQWESILIGLSVDKKNGSITLDIVEQPAPGSELEENQRKDAAAKSKLAGFYDPKSQVGFHGVIIVPPEMIPVFISWAEWGIELGMMTDPDLDEDMIPIIMDRWEVAKQIFVDTLGTGTWDLACSSYYDKSGEFLSGLFASSVADGAAVEKVLKRFAQEDDISLEFVPNAIMDGVHVYRVHAPKGEFAIALTKAYIFVAFEQQRDPVKVLKEKVTTSLKSAPQKINSRFHIDGIALNDLYPGDGYGGKFTIHGYTTKRNSTSRIVVDQKFLSSAFHVGMMLFQQMQNDGMDDDYDYYDDRGIGGGFGGW